MPSWPAVAIKPETVSGIRTYQMNLVLDIVFSIFALVLAATAMLAVSSDASSAFASAAVIGSAACGLVIVFIINFIVGLMSVFKMHHGLREYGPEHERSARMGVLFKWTGTALSTMAAILVVYLVFSGFLSFYTPGQVPITIYVPLLVTAFWTGGVSAKAQMYRLMVRALQPPNTRRWTDVASIAIPVLGIVGVGLVGFVTARVIGTFSNPASIDYFEASRLSQILIGGVFLPPGLALFGYAVFLVVYRQTIARLDAGLAQMYGGMVGYGMWPGYAMPPPAMPFPAPGWAPPPPPTAPPPTAQVRACPQCGRPTAGEAFCPNCGARLGA